MANFWRNSIHLLLELNIVYFFILLMYLDSGNLPSLVGVLLPYGFAIAIFGFLNNKLPNNYAAIMMVAPILALFAYLSSYSIWLALMIGTILSFRAFMYFVEERFLSTFALLIISFIWMPFVYGAGTLVNYPHGQTLMILFGAQLALVIFLYSGNAVLQLNGNRYMQKRVVAATSTVFISIIALSAVFATIGKYLITAGFSLFGLGVSFIFDILARPVFALLGMLDWTPKSGGPQDEGGLEGEEEEEAETAELLPPPDSLFDNPVVMAIGVILFLAILYYLLRKKKVNTQKIEVKAEQSFTSTMTKKSGGFFTGRRKQKPPENEVRKLMFDLEQLAMKKNRGRLPNETLEEWLKRETTFKESFMDLYAKVRYGEIKLSPSEVETCRTMAEEIRKVMKQWKKAS